MKIRVSILAVVLFLLALTSWPPAKADGGMPAWISGLSAAQLVKVNGGTRSARTGAIFSWIGVQRVEEEYPAIAEAAGAISSEIVVQLVAPRK